MKRTKIIIILLNLIIVLVYINWTIAQKEKTISRFMAKANKTKMAQSMKKQLDKMERLEVQSEDTSVMNIYFPPAPRAGRIVVEANEVVKNYGELQVLDRVGIKVERGDRVAFVGQNGQGKTTLSKILIGKEYKFSDRNLDKTVWYCLITLCCIY